jgi:MoaA/NifB/PqqE/SkfB family radical SAM enzyme
MNSEEKTLCSAFWKHTNIRNNNLIYPCCRFKSPIQKFDGNVESILHSKEYEQLRTASLNGEHIDGCTKCYYEEEQGKRSLRQKFNEEHSINKVELEFLEVGLDNICNLTCDGCWAEFSSSWSEKQYPDKPKSFHIRSSSDLDRLPSSLKKILFLGGEPLMTKRHYKILQKIEDKSEVSVTYNTNGTFQLDSETISLLKEFKQVHFIVSVDGYGKLNEKVRSGTVWGDVITFIQSIKRLKFSITLHTVVHLNNWHGLGELAEFTEYLNLDWTTNVLTYPAHLDIRNVSDKLKCKEYLETIENLPNKSYIIKHLESNENIIK